MIFIYTISDPRTGEVRYVGKTNNTYYRFKRHIYEAKKSTSSHKNAWIRSLLKLNISPVFDIVDECEKDDWIIIEQYWISQFKAWGFNLTNECSGGEGVILSGKNKRMKPIYQFNKSGTLIKKFDGYLSILEEYPTFKRQGIQECCLGILRSYKSFIFLYTDHVQAVRKNPRLTLK